MTWLTWLIGILTFASPNGLLAEELPVNYVPVRAIGMGGASAALSNDENSLFTNPAGIARVRKARSRKTNNLTSIPNLLVGLNGESRDFYEVLSKTDDKSVENILAQSEDLGNKPFWARASAFPVTMVEMGRGNPTAFGLFANNRASSLISKEEPGVARTTVISDVGAALGFALTNRNNLATLGFSLRPTYRYAYEDKIPSDILLDKTELPKRIKAGANKSSGIGMDVGFLYTLADFWFPTLGVSVLNLPTGCKENYLNPYSETRQTVCGTVYSGDIGNPEALSTVDPMDLRVGLSILPRITRKVALRLAMDLHHLNVPMGDQNYGLTDIDIAKSVHAGLELVFGNPLDPEHIAFRVGLNQGYFTMGASLTFGMLAIDFASYGVDVSPTPTPIEDRRYLMGLSLRL
jgi:hypothetical protein